MLLLSVQEVFFIYQVTLQIWSILLGHTVAIPNIYISLSFSFFFPVITLVCHPIFLLYIPFIYVMFLIFIVTIQVFKTKFSHSKDTMLRNLSNLYINLNIFCQSSNTSNSFIILHNYSNKNFFFTRIYRELSFCSNVKIFITN